MSLKFLPDDPDPAFFSGLADVYSQPPCNGGNAMDDNNQLKSSGRPPEPGARPTLKTIAFMTGLGITTVSRALKDAPDIGMETKERVRLVAAQLGYQPNRQACACGQARPMSLHLC